jgi:hypothetical protein
LFRAKQQVLLITLMASLALMLVFSFVAFLSTSKYVVYADFVEKTIPLQQPLGARVLFGDPVLVLREDAIAFNPEEGNMYIVHVTDPGRYTVIDVNTDTVTSSVELKEAQQAGIAFNPANNVMYATNAASNTVSVIRTTDFDTDGDFIFDRVDPEPSAFSNNFTDIVEFNVTTFGSIIERGNQSYFSIGDAPNPEGVIVTAINTTGRESVAGRIDSCGPGAGLAITEILPGSVYPITCSSYGSIFHLGPVEQGTVSTTLVAEDMRRAHLDVSTGNSISFDFATGAITAASSNTATLTIRRVLHESGSEFQLEFPLAPGETLFYW